MNANLNHAQSPTPVSDAAIREDWPVFAEIVRQGLVAGARTYGDGSFGLPADRLAEEISQELRDVMGWGFILWHRMQVLMEKLRAMEAAASNG